MEGFGEVQRGLSQRKPAPGCPEVKDVAVDGTLRSKALKDVLAHIRREGTISLARLGVNRTSTAALWPAFRHPLQAAHVLQDLFDRDLLPQRGKVDPRAVACRLRGVGLLDRRGRRVYLGISRGDRF